MQILFVCKILLVGLNVAKRPHMADPLAWPLWVVGLLRVCNRDGGSASEQASAVLSQGATNMMIRCAHISASVDYCSLSVQLQRQRPCLENASQCHCACGLRCSASSIGELQWRAGRFMHSSPSRQPRTRFSVVSSSNLPEW